MVRFCNTCINTSLFVIVSISMNDVHKHPRTYISSEKCSIEAKVISAPRIKDLQTMPLRLVSNYSRLILWLFKYYPCFEQNISSARYE